MTHCSLGGCPNQRGKEEEAGVRSNNSPEKALAKVPGNQGLATGMREESSLFFLEERGEADCFRLPYQLF